MEGVYMKSNDYKFLLLYICPFGCRINEISAAAYLICGGTYCLMNFGDD
jgi:hypothetical protein